MPATALSPFLLQPSDPGTRQWLAFTATNYDGYVFVLEQLLDKKTGNWGAYAAGWSTGNLYYQTLVYGPRLPHAPNIVPGSPFAEYADAVAACEAVLPSLN